MKIAFFGHRNFCPNDEIKAELLNILKEETCGENVEFLLGGYGNFDAFALKIVNEFCKYKAATRIFVTPYIDESHQKNHLELASQNYDAIIYPEIENVPYRFAISARNKWIANECDLVICYIKRKSGGAYSAVRYAKGKGKIIVNLSKESAS